MLYLFDNYVLDSDRRELRCGFETVAIEPQAFDLLEHLIRQRERVVSRDELIESIWRGRIVSESALSTRINAVRSAIGDSGIGQRLIKTLPRKGLRFVGEVREEEHKAREAAQASAPKEDVSGPDEVRQPDGSLPAGQTFDSPADAPSPAMVAPAKPRRFPGLRANAGAVAAIGLVFSAEGLNTAIEAVVDLASPELHPLAEKAKDVAAGAVLLTAIAAVVIGLLVFGPHVVLLVER